MSADEATCGAVPPLTIRAQAGRNGPCVWPRGIPVGTGTPSTAMLWTGPTPLPSGTAS